MAHDRTPAGERSRTRLGRSGESLAATTLEARGLRILVRNWRCSYGEIDLIAEDRGELVFVEVKTRRGLAMGAPEEAITPRKRRHLVAAAQSYLEACASQDVPYRIDVVAITLSPQGTLLSVRHYARAVAGEE